MKFSTALPLLAGAGVALASQDLDVLSSRQVHVDKRGLIDVCVGLDVDLDILGIVVGHLDVCLCLSVLPDFVKTNPVCQSGSMVGGDREVQSTLENLINNHANKQNCTYPDHADPFCASGAPCNYHCKDGFQPQYDDGVDCDNPGNNIPKDCTCPPPMSVCNGQCGNFPHGCGSQAPSSRRRRSNAPKCDAGKTICGVPGGSHGRGWECIDTTSDLESCGGCAIASPFDSLTSRAKVGVDCSALPHVSSVSCKASACVVEACASGFEPSPAKDACIAVAVAARRHIVDAAGAEGLVADVAGLVGVKEGAAGVAKVGRDLVDAAGAEGLVADVAGLVGVKEGAVGDVHVLRDLVGAAGAEGLVADVAGLVGVKEGAVGDVHVLRGLVDAAGAEGLVGDVAGLVGVGEGAVGGLNVGRGLVDAAGAEGLVGNVAGLVGVKEGAVGDLHVL
ncbi:hypothetical protein DENSPDRAFT_193617 [Dentipellis sp. KUC8613]|nr:hypothetical protein DENSPDRAFT_193617 [Dentipellis sp. KUC8613]